MTQDLKQRVEEVFSIPLNRYHDTKLLQDRLLMASKLLKDITQEYNNVIKELTNRQTKLEEALQVYDKTANLHTARKLVRGILAQIEKEC